MTITSIPVYGPQQALSEEMSKDKELPVTSYPCKWNVPHARKDSTLRVSETHFDYRRVKKAKYTSVHYFDPRPIQYRGTAHTQLETFLCKMKGKKLGVSLLFDPSFSVLSTEKSVPVATYLPNKQQLKESIVRFKLSFLYQRKK